MMKPLPKVCKAGFTAGFANRLFLTVLLMSAALSVLGQTTVNYNITANTTWTTAGSPYTIATNITVSNGVTLTVESGVTVQFNDNLQMTVLGTMNATGATFTSGNASPTAGIWNRIQVGSGGTQGSAVLTNCQVLYGRNVYVDNGTASIDNTNFSNISDNAVYVSPGDSLYLANSNITGALRGVYGAASSRINIQNTSITGVSHNAIALEGSSVALVKGITISETGRTGFYAVNVPDVTLEGATISNTTSNAIHLVNTNATLSTINTTNTSDSYTNSAALYVSGPSQLALTDVSLANATYPIELRTGDSYGAPNLSYAGTNTFTSNITHKVVFINDSRLHAGTFRLDSIGVPYYFNQEFTVYNGSSMEVGSGSKIKFASGKLNIAGTLKADANAGGNITFTSFRDDNVGGDSNNDVNASSPASGNWTGINFLTTSTASSLSHCTVKFAGYNHTTTNRYGAVTTESASPSINNCELRNSVYGAVFKGTSAPVFTNNTLAANDVTPVAMSFEASPTFTSNSFSSSENTYDAIGLIGGTMVGNANVIKRDFTDIPNISYVILDDITVPSSYSLNIAPGVVFKSISGHTIFVEGNINAIGTAEEPIIITSVSDDNYGNPGDTQNDGTARTPSRADFGAISFLPGSGATSTIENCMIKFSNGRGHHVNGYNSYIAAFAPIQVIGAAPTIHNNQISEVNFGIAAYLGATPTISNNTITNSAAAPFALSASSNPSYSGNTFSSVGWKALGLIDENVTSDATIRQRNVGGFENITYVMINNLTVNEGANLSLDSALVIKFVGSNRFIDVYGGLAINGKTDYRVTLTSLADDNAGASTTPEDNDTESNGNATEPAPGSWGGIRFYASSNDAFSVIKHTDILYSGTPQNYHSGTGSAAFIIDGASPTFEAVNINQSGGFGMNFTGVSAPLLNGVTIRNCNWDPFAMSLFSDPNFASITLVQNGSNGIRINDHSIGSNATIEQRSFAGIENVAYIIGYYLTVESNATLTVNPGVVIKSSSYNLGVNGTLKAIGTEAEPIVFTSFQDDSRGGDTNIDGNNSGPAAGNWQGLVFNASSTGSEVRQTEIRYGRTAITSVGSDVVVDNNIIELMSEYGFDTRSSSTATFTNNILRNIRYTPVLMSAFDNPTFSGNTLENVGIIGIQLLPETLSQSDTIPQRSFAGYDNITYILGDACYYCPAVFNVNEGSELTILPGTVFKKRTSSRAIYVDGKLNIAGTAANPVIFTAIADDEYGNPKDTEEDGALTNPEHGGQYNHGNWIYFNAISDDASVVDNALFRYIHGYVVELNSAAPTIRNNIFEYSGYGIRNTGVSTPIIEGNTFKDLWQAPMTISLVAYPASTANNTLSGTTWKGIEVNSETLTQDIELPKRPFAGINNIPYIFSNYRVGPGVVLTIAPGVVNKFTGSLTIDGALVADGGHTNDSTIVFTTLGDDFYGGDTDSDSTYAHNHTQWSGITFENVSMDGQSKIDYAIVKGATYYYGGLGIKLNSASPTITNTHFIGNHTGLSITGASNPVLSGNDFIGNTNYGINNTGSFQVDATGSWWGHNSGPKHSANPEGLGEAVSDNVLFDPWATQGSLNPLSGDVSLNGSVTAYDAALVLQAVVDLSVLDAKQAEVADVSGEAGVGAMDAAYILQFAANLIQSFPSESTHKRTNEQFVSTASAVLVKPQDVVLAEGSNTITVPLMLENVASLHALQASLNYDPKVLRFTGIEKAELSADLNLAQNHNEAQGKIAMAFALPAGLESDGLLLNLQFEVLNTAVGYSYLEVGKATGNETDVTSLASAARITINSKVTGIEEMLADKGVVLYPNPAAEEVKLSFMLQKTDKIEVALYNSMGQQLRVLAKKEMTAGVNTLSFSRKDLAVEPGVYFLKGSLGDKPLLQQLILH